MAGIVFRRRTRTLPTREEMRQLIDTNVIAPNTARMAELGFTDAQVSAYVTAMEAGERYDFSKKVLGSAPRRARRTQAKLIELQAYVTSYEANPRNAERYAAARAIRAPMEEFRELRREMAVGKGAWTDADIDRWIAKKTPNCWKRFDPVDTIRDEKFKTNAWVHNNLCAIVFEGLAYADSRQYLEQWTEPDGVDVEGQPKYQIIAIRRYSLNAPALPPDVVAGLDAGVVARIPWNPVYMVEKPA